MSAKEAGTEEPITILLVEPNPGDTRLFTESLHEAKLANRLYTVTNGEDALDFLHGRGEYESNACPDLVLLEPQLPGKSGMEILSELNDEPALAEIPVVVLTGSDAEEDIVKSQDVDADHYIQKPVTPDDFFQFVRSIEDFWFAIVQEPTN
ncbi:response regulator [Saliphagus sp. GCM10025317]